MRALAAAVLCCVAAAPALADAPVPKRAEVRALMARVARAAQARDLVALAAALAPDCRIELRTLIDGREQITLLTRAEYLQYLADGFAALKTLESYDYRADELSLAIDREPPGATVVSQIRESFRLGDQRLVTDSRETARVERRGGGLKLVAVSAVTAGR